MDLEIYHGYGGSGNRCLVVNTTVSLTPPESPSTNDIWINNNNTLNKIFFSNDEPTSISDGDLWLKISAEYIDPHDFITGRNTFTPRTVSREYDIYGGKSSGNIKIMTSDIYDLWVSLGFVQQYNGSSWVYCPAYYWNGSAWVQHSWDNFYVYGGNPVIKVAPDSTASNIETGLGTTVATIVKTDPLGKVYVGDNAHNTLRCYSPSGSLLWTYTPTLNPSGNVIDICFDLTGNIYILRGTSTPYIDKISSSGIFIGQIYLGSSQKIKVDKLGRLLVLRSTATSSIYCYTPNWESNEIGTAVWYKQASNIGVSPYKFDLDADGNAYCDSTASSSYKLSSDGVTLTSIPASCIGGLIVTPNYIYCVSYVSGSAVIKVFDYSLNLISTTTYTISNGYCVGACVDLDGYVYLFTCGTAGGNLVKLPPASNSPLYTVSFSPSGTTNFNMSEFAVTPGLYSDFPSAW